MGAGAALDSIVGKNRKEDGKMVVQLRPIAFTNELHSHLSEILMVRVRHVEHCQSVNWPCSGLLRI